MKEHKNAMAWGRAAVFFTAALACMAAFALAAVLSPASVEASARFSRFRDGAGGLVPLMARAPDNSGDVVASRDIGK